MNRGMKLLLPLVTGSALAWSAASLAAEPQSRRNDFTFEAREDTLGISFRGQRVANYVYRDRTILRPYFARLHAPGGIQVTRNHPPLPGKDATDHDTMHPGLWLAFGDISGQDYWRNKAVIKHERFAEAPVARGGRLTFATENRLQTTNGQSLGTLMSRITLAARPDGYLLIWEAVFTAGEQEIAFGDQEEMGLGVRVATAITEKNGGLITASTGEKTAKATWGKAFDWCDYSGVIGSQRVGVILMPDPANFRPSWFHNRDYGLMVANPFGREAMKQGKKSSVTVKRGESLRLRFGALVYSVAPDREVDFPAAYRDFVATVASPENADRRTSPGAFVSIPAGSFLMGADLSRDQVTAEKGVFIQDEFSVRRVMFTRGFDISKHEVTNLEYE